ncbi:unnamed protein product [Malus baccata var. baccata]
MSALTLRRNIDFGNGGAFPEIHMPQYPLGMGRDKISKPGRRFFQLQLMPMGTLRMTGAQPNNVPKQSSDLKYFKFMPSEKSGAFNSGAKERMIKMVEKPVDPLEPPKFKHKRVPRPSGSPPVPVMHSPPRPVSAKDQKEWTKIPPCTSNWKNPKGYTIPLDKRLVADGRGLHDVLINDNFAKLAESLYEKAREEIEAINQVKLELNKKEKEKKERELRELARKARSERAGMDADVPKETEKHGERKTKRRLEAKDGAMGKKSKTTRDRDRDISEKRAAEGERYDHRLFNQEKGMDSGFATDDQHNVYDKGLIMSQPTISTLYRPTKDVDSKMYGGADEQLDKIRKTDRKPDRGFGGTDERAAGQRDGPVEFERDVAEETDLFGLDRLITKMKKAENATD